MQPQLIIIGPDGHIRGLDFKNKGLPLRQFGCAKISRVSDIVWNDITQSWVIRLMQGEYAGQCVTPHIRQMIGEMAPTRVSVLIHTGEHGPFQFIEYEDAVAFEVALIQAAERNGTAHLVINAG